MLYIVATPTPARAQNYYNEDAAPAAQGDSNPLAGLADKSADVSPSHTVVVTSIGKCYAQLGRADEIDIEQHYLKPYEECQRRLALKLQQQHEVKPGQKAAAPVQHAVVTPQFTPPTAATPGQAVDGPPDNPGPAAPPLSDEGLYFRVQKNKLPTNDPSPAATTDDKNSQYRFNN